MPHILTKSERPRFVLIFVLQAYFFANGHGSAAYLFLTIKRFPVEGYKPLQDPPISDVAKATELASCLKRLLPAVRLHDPLGGEGGGNSGSVWCWSVTPFTQMPTSFQTSFFHILDIAFM